MVQHVLHGKIIEGLGLSHYHQLLINQESPLGMEALIAIFSILYLFWPLVPLFGVREFFSKDLAVKERLRLGFQRMFFGWVVWALFLGYIYWQGAQPILFMSEGLNHLLFGFLGLITGGITVGGMIHRWRNRRVRLSDAQRLEDLLLMTPDNFEALIAALFQAYGYQTQVSGGNADHGVDVIVHPAEDEKWIVQCKRYSGSVGEPVVRDLYGTMLHEDAARAYLMTTGSFTRQATDWASGKPLLLYDGEALIKLIRRTHKRMG